METIAREEELALARQARTGDRSALDRLVRCHIRFVVHVAKEFRGRGVPLEDLVAEGSVGLLKAVSRFDPEAGTRFMTFASFWVRKSILQALVDQPRVVRITRYARTQRHEAPREVWIEGVPESETARKDKTAPERLIAKQERQRLRAHVLELSTREQAILATRYGLHGEPALTLGQVGARMGLSRERVRQIEVAAIGRLRMRLRTRPRATMAG